jgi:hypothetical protein
MRILIGVLFLIGVLPVFSQDRDTEGEKRPVKIDSLYREDQFYFGFGLNTLQKKPVGLVQDKFSAGFSLGFLRDFPMNKSRTIAIAPGLGVAYNNFNQNLKISKINSTPVYSIIDSNIDYERNRFSQFLVEIPIEFRWRSSTFESHKFWRVYGGFKMGYLLYDKSLFRDAKGTIEVFNNDDFNKLQYGTYIAAGYNSINIIVYYGFTPLFNKAKIVSESIVMNALNVGIQFYIL